MLELAHAYLVQHLQGGEVVGVFLLRRHRHAASSLGVDALVPDVSKTQTKVLTPDHDRRRSLAALPD